MSTAPIGGHATDTMRQGPRALTRDSRERFLPTKNRPAALHRDLGATREYQSDSSSKRPGPSVVSGWFALSVSGRSPPTPEAPCHLTGVVPYRCPRLLVGPRPPPAVGGRGQGLEGGGVGLRTLAQPAGGR